MILQIISFRRRELPADLPCPDICDEGPWYAVCVSPLPWVKFDRIKREDLEAHGRNKEEAIANLTDQIKDLMLKNPYIEQVETSAIQV